MESANLVIDEWLWADLGCDDSARRNEAFQFLKAIFAKCDKMVLVKDSPFARKADAFWSHTDWPRRQIAIYLNEKFWWNTEKTLRKNADELLELPEIFQDEVKPADRYLVSAFLTTNAQVIVTTDNPLIDTLRKHGITCEHREKFLPSYIAQYGLR